MDENFPQCEQGQMLCKHEPRERQQRCLLRCVWSMENSHGMGNESEKLVDEIFVEIWRSADDDDTSSTMGKLANLRLLFDTIFLQI